MKLVINDTLIFDKVETVNENFYPAKDLSITFDSNVEYDESFEKLESDEILDKIVVILDNSTEIDFSSKFNKVDRIIKKITTTKRNTEGIQITFIKEY